MVRASRLPRGRARHRWLLLVAVPLVLAACGKKHDASVAQEPDFQPTATSNATAPASTTQAPAAPAVRPSATPRSPSPAATRSAAASRTHSSAPTSTHSPSPAPKPKPKPTATAYVIKAVDYQFRPANLTVPVGATVTFKNAGPSSHTFTQGTAPVHTPGGFDSGNTDAGQSYTFTFHTSGAFNFFCQYHYSSGMKGRITVQ
jgi:plastocyanin